MTIRRVLLMTVGLILSVSAGAFAQECLGISAGTRAYVSYGAEGTDGVTGQALTVGLRLREFNVQLHGRTMDPGGRSFSSGVDGRMNTVALQVAHPITKKLPLCVFGGLGWTGYDIERFNAGQTTTSPYTQIQVPLGISLGKEFKLSDNFSISSFVQNAAVYQLERGDVFDGRRVQEHNLGVGVTAGLGISYGPLMLRSTISNYKLLKNSFGLYNDFPYMSLQLGVKF